jgi:hypothetical protein
MEPTGAVHTPRAQAVTAAAVAAALALVYASGVPGLSDSDPYSHLAYARALWESGLSLRGHPFLPLTILGKSGVDLWLGFHWLLLPFAPLGVLWGARIAGACIAAVVAGTLAWLLFRFRPGSTWAFGIAPLLLSGTFALRGNVARPAHLTVPLLLIELLCGAGTLPRAAAAGAAFAHGLLHLSAPLAPLFAAVGWFGARLAGRRGTERAVLWAVAGLGVALIARPDRGSYLALALLTNLQALGLSGAQLPMTGSELLTMPAKAFVQETGPGLALIVLAAVLGRRLQRRGTPEARYAALLATALCLAATVRGRRFVDYAVPMEAFCAGLLWPAAGVGPRARRYLVPALALVAALLFAVRVHDTWILGRKTPEPPETMARIAADVRARVPAGSMIFTDDPFVTEVIYSALPEYRYVLMYDPAVLYLESAPDFWRWYHAAWGAYDCTAPRCPDARANATDAARAVKSFGADWMITSAALGVRSLQEVARRSPAQFEFIDYAPGAVHGLALWRVR